MKHTTKLLSAIVVLGMLASIFSILGTISIGAASDAYDGTPVTPTIISSSTYRDLGLAEDKWSQYNGYYAIRNASELYGFAEIVNNVNSSANAVLLDDIVVNSGTVNENGAAYKWVGIGSAASSNSYYKGTFDGNGHYVSGLYYKPDEGISASYVGFFQVLSGATVKNLILKNSYFYAESDIGAIAGHALGSTSNIINCRIEEDVTVVKGEEGQEAYLGGILGGNPLGGGGTRWPIYCKITNCVFLGTVRTMMAAFTDGQPGREFIGAISGASVRAGNAHKHVVLSNCFYRSACIQDKNGNTEYTSGYLNNNFETAMGGEYNSVAYWGTSVGAETISSTSDSHNPIVSEHIGIKVGDSSYKYCVLCNKRMATITVTSPTSYVIPGTSMRLSAQTEYSEVTDFYIEAGTNYTANGMTFKTSVDALVGSEITVKVKSAETANVHAAEITVKFVVGVVDTTTEINRLQDELDNAIAALSASLMAEDEDITEEINALKSAMTQAQNTITTLQNNSATKDQLATLKSTLEQADSNITAAYTKAINDARGELEELINEAKEAATNGDTALESNLRNHISEVQRNLETLIDAAEQTAAKNNKDLKEELTKAIENATKASQDADKALEEKLQNNIDDAIEKAEKDLNSTNIALRTVIYYAQESLNNAIADLDTAMKNGDKDLTEKIESLNTALENAKALLELADEENKRELEAKIDAADAVLEAAIDALSTELNNVKSELENTKAELENKDKELETFIIVVCVVSGVAFLGCGTLSTFYIIDKKRKI